MKKLNVGLAAIIMMMISLMLILPGCKNKKELVVNKKPATEKKAEAKATQQPLDDDENIFQEKIDKLVQDIKIKEAELEAKTKMLEEKLVEIRDKQVKLESVEARMQKLQTWTIVILIVGIIAVLVGLVMIFKKRNAQQETAAPEKKTETKEKPETKTTARKLNSGGKKTS